MDKKIIQKYTPLVKSIAVKYSNNNVQFDDLVQEGTIGLWKAWQNYDESREAKFSTYAVYWIKKFILEAVNKEKKTSLNAISFDDSISTKREEHEGIKENYKVESFYDGETFLEFLKEKTPDLVVLDLMLPAIDGLQVCSKIRADENLVHIPIIMLTAKSTEVDKVVGLEMGADDYMVKPFSPRELVARVKAVLRRTEKTKSSQKSIIEYDSLKLNLDKYEAILEGKQLDLTTTEFNLLSILASHPGWVYSRNKLLDMLWGQDKIVLDRTIDVHVQKLRKKLGKMGEMLKTVRGVGYKFEQ